MRSHSGISALLLATVVTSTAAGVEPAPKIILESRYLTMRDGVRIAVDVVRPPSRRALPTLLNLTRYWRASLDEDPSSHAAFFAERGYAVVLVDVRGTGASSGVWTAPWSAAEVQDGYEVVTWIVQQPWSNGRVGAYGTSYSANAALLLASTKHPALKAIAPAFFELDLYTDHCSRGACSTNGWCANGAPQTPRSIAERE